MDVIANNLANMSTPAYKRESMRFQEYVDQLPHAPGQTSPKTLSFVQDTGVMRDMSEGQLKRTDAPFDLAIDGKGFFAVQTPNGTRYTRNGHFSLNAEGQLVTDSGAQVLGEGGPITITPDDGDIHIAADGTVSGKQGQLGKLRLVNFASASGLVKQGASLYSTGETPQPVTGSSIEQGMIETSNVHPVLEMSNMLQVMRNYQATSSLTKTQEAIMRQAIQKLGAMPS
jgi:flagellar basal-body rod protein FlgF